MIWAFVAVLLAGFAWAIGGEHGFGKWRRGILMYLPLFIVGVSNHLHWSYYLITLMITPVLYQMLFYGMCIDDGINQPEGWKRILGWIGILLNGMICGVNIMVFIIFQCIAYPMDPIVDLGKVITAGIFFALVVAMSNLWKLKAPFCFKIGEVKVFCPEDCWWIACFVYGMLLMSLTL